MAHGQLLAVLYYRVKLHIHIAQHCEYIVIGIANFAGKGQYAFLGIGKDMRLVASDLAQSKIKGIHFLALCPGFQNGGIQLGKLRHNIACKLLITHHGVCGL